MERGKKKALVDIKPKALSAAEVKTNEKTVLRFLSPELVSVGADEDISGFDKKPSWDVAVRYQDLKRLLSIPDPQKEKLKKRAIEGVLQRAKAILGSVMKPEKPVLLSYTEFIHSGQRGEIDLLSSFEAAFEKGINPSRQAVDIESLKFDSRQEKQNDVLLLMDASLSMTGEKIALLAVATAVVALCLPSRRLSLVSFASNAKLVKGFQEHLSISEIIARILEIPSHGLTNLEQGLSKALEVESLSHKRSANTILISDGKYTEGKDPTYLASRFEKLHALKLGRDIAGRALLRDLITQGHGQFFEARKIEDLPRTMYQAMRQLLR